MFGTTMKMAGITACVIALGAGCSDSDHNGTSTVPTRETATPGAPASADDTAGGADCSLVEAGTVADLFGVEFEVVEETMPALCFFIISYEPHDAISVGRIDFDAQGLYDEAVADAEFYFGAGLVPVDIGDEAMAGVTDGLVQLDARAGDVYVSVSASLELGGDQDAHLAAATALADLVL